MNNKIMEVVTVNESYHKSLTVHVNTTLELAIPIIVEFTSDSRNDTGYSIEYEPTQDIFGGRYTYLRMSKRTHRVISSEVLTILNNLGYTDNTDWLLDKLLENIDVCIGKCESRYGNSVEDFNLTGYDACLTIN